MKMLKVLEKRKTIRTYEDTPLTDESLDRIQWLLKDLPNVGQSDTLSFEILKNGFEVYDKLNGTIGYNGIMIKAPHYIIITCEGTLKEYQHIGYLGEWIALNFAQMDIGTCWLEAGPKSGQVKELLGLTDTGIVAALIAFGEPNEDKKLSRIYDQSVSGSASALTQMGYPYIDASVKDENYSYRKSVVEIVDLKTFGNEITLAELSQRGLDEIFWYMRLAPSWGNLQPWKFILDGDQIVLTIEINPNLAPSIQRIDAGIGMLYLEIATHDKGFDGHWVFDEADIRQRLSIPETFFIAGYFTN